MIFLSNSFFSYLMKMKNKKQTVFRFPFCYKNKKQKIALKIQIENLLNMKKVVSYLIFVFCIERITNKI